MHLASPSCCHRFYATATAQRVVAIAIAVSHACWRGNESHRADRGRDEQRQCVDRLRAAENQQRQHDATADERWTVPNFGHWLWHRSEREAGRRVVHAGVTERHPLDVSACCCSFFERGRMLSVFPRLPAKALVCSQLHQARRQAACRALATHSPSFNRLLAVLSTTQSPVQLRSVRSLAASKLPSTG